MGILATQELGERKVMLFGDGRPDHFNVVSRAMRGGVQHWRYPLKVEDGVLAPRDLVEEMRQQRGGQAGIELACLHFRCTDPQGAQTSPRKRRQRPGDGIEGTQVLRRDEFVLIWKQRRPMPWANFAVVLADERKRKRSFHFAWNGERFNQTQDIERLENDEPAVFEQVEQFLADNISRFHRPFRQRWWDVHGENHGEEMNDE